MCVTAVIRSLQGLLVEIGIQITTLSQNRKRQGIQYLVLNEIRTSNSLSNHSYECEFSLVARHTPRLLL